MRPCSSKTLEVTNKTPRCGSVGKPWTNLPSSVIHLPWTRRKLLNRLSARATSSGFGPCTTLVKKVAGRLCFQRLAVESLVLDTASCRSKRVDEHNRFYANFKDFCSVRV